MTRPLVIFDGYCVLCNRSVDFIQRRDRNGIFRYVALQSEAGDFLTRIFDIPSETQSVILIHKRKVYFRSEAALVIASMLRKPWSWLEFLKVLPLSLRDTVYNFIAAKRYQWFGKRNDCRVPTEKERQLFPTVDELKLEFPGFELPV